jgi:hypothetical protein
MNNWRRMGGWKDAWHFHTPHGSHVNSKLATTTPLNCLLCHWETRLGVTGPTPCSEPVWSYVNSHLLSLFRGLLALSSPSIVYACMCVSVSVSVCVHVYMCVHTCVWCGDESQGLPPRGKPCRTESHPSPSSGWLFICAGYLNLFICTVLLVATCASDWWFYSI